MKLFIEHDNGLRQELLAFDLTQHFAVEIKDGSPFAVHDLKALQELGMTLGLMGNGKKE